MQGDSLAQKVELLKADTEHEERAPECIVSKDAGKDNSTEVAEAGTEHFVEKKVFNPDCVCVGIYSFFLVLVIDLWMCRLKKKILQLMMETPWRLNRLN